MEYLLFAFIGIVIGLLAGLFGIGGGLIAVPGIFLAYRFYLSVPHPMHFAVVISLGSIIFGAASSMISQIVRKSMDWRILFKLAIGIFLGSLLGVYIGKGLPSPYLKIGFSVLVFLLGLYVFFSKDAENSSEKKYTTRRTFFAYFCFSVVASFLSAIFGLGGGVFFVPILCFMGYQITYAVGTSSGASFFTAILAVLYYYLFDFHDQRVLFTSHTVTHMVLIGAFSALMAPFGVKFSHSLNKSILRRLYAVLLLVIGVGMFFI